MITRCAKTVLFTTILAHTMQAEELPPDILADSYLLQAAKAMREQDEAAAIRALRKIEDLDIEPPQEFGYLLGKLLVENSTEESDYIEALDLLKSFIITSPRDSVNYPLALELMAKARDVLIRDGSSTLSLAALHGHTEIVALLLDAGVDVNVSRGEYEPTPLHFAVRSGNAEVVALLLNAGADVNEQRKIMGHTPLHNAAQLGHAEVVALLLDKGADATILDHIGWSPFDAADDSLKGSDVYRRLKEASLR